MFMDQQENTTVISRKAPQLWGNAESLAMFTLFKTHIWALSPPVLDKKDQESLSRPKGNHITREVSSKFYLTRIVLFNTRQVKFH